MFIFFKSKFVNIFSKSYYSKISKFEFSSRLNVIYFHLLLFLPIVMRLIHVFLKNNNTNGQLEYTKQMPLDTFEKSKKCKKIISDVVQ